MKRMRGSLRESSSFGCSKPGAPIRMYSCGRRSSSTRDVIGALLSILPILACGGGGSDTGPPPPPPPPTVGTVSVSGATVALGGTVPRTAAVKDANGNPISQTVTWTTDNAGIAQVSTAGVVTGVAAGSTTIRASAGGRTGTATIVATDLEFSSVSSGAQHACALRGGLSGGLYCWGDYSFGAAGLLPDPETCETGQTCSATPRQGVTGPTLSQVSAGGNHSCGLTADGVAYCWGDNFIGQLGAPASETCSYAERRCSRSPMAVIAGGTTFTVISAGGGHTCALTAAGVAYCWGFGQDGQLGAPTSQACNGFPCSPTPVAVSGGLTFRTLNAGVNHSCGITGDGMAYCWGRNNSGQLGHAGTGSSPGAVGGGLVFSSLSAGSEHTCGVTTVGFAYCWGGNTFGQLGNGTTEARPAPAPVSGELRFSSISAGAQHTCGVTTMNAVYCWGNNDRGQLGAGNTSGSLTAVPVQRGLPFTQVSVGFFHSCARTTSNRVYCWGRNHFGQLGTGAIAVASSSVPVGVAGLP
jgi:alpha-tubulin suppressor-like RCC1 family protein